MSHYSLIWSRFSANFSPEVLLTQEEEEEEQRLAKAEACLEQVWEDFSEDSVFPCKSSASSEHHRRKGNAAYSAKDWSAALRNYNLALLHGERKSELGLAYANRSACLMAMGEYALSLDDCRTGIAFLQDVDDDDSIKSDSSANETARRKLKEREMRLEDTLASYVDYFQEKRSQGENWIRSKFLQDAGNDLYQVQRDEVKGRLAVAIRDLEPGSVVIQDPGYAFTLERQFDTEHCAQCGCTLLAGLLGRFDFFCSQNCLREYKDTNVFHYLHAVNLKEYNLPYKILLNTGQHKLLQIWKCETRSEKEATEAPANLQLNLIRTFASHPEDAETERKLLFDSSLLTRLLLKYDFNDAPRDPSFRSWLTRLIYKLLRSLPYNVITLSEWVTTEGPLSHYFWAEAARAKSLKVETRAYGTGVFALVGSYVNHNCDPNCVFIKHGKLAGSLITSRRIREGEELTISYGMAQHGREARRAWLAKGYRFNCGCSRCQEEKDDLVNINRIHDIHNSQPPSHDHNDPAELGPDLHWLTVVKHLLKERELVRGLDSLCSLLNRLDYDNDKVTVRLGQEVMRRVLVEIGMA